MSRRDLDYYPTPPDVTRAILDTLAPQPGAVVLDPSCGDGAILDVASERWCVTRGIELDSSRASTALAKGHAVTAGDALARSWPSCDLLVQNPPFSLALDFVRRAAQYAAERGSMTASLVRLSFLSSKGRAAFHREHPADVYVLAGRPSFTGDGKVDQVDYVWLVHGPGVERRWSVLEWQVDAKRRAA